MNQGFIKTKVDQIGLENLAEQRETADREQADHLRLIETETSQCMRQNL
jgi:hypothetical protein